MNDRLLAIRNLRIEAASGAVLLEDLSFDLTTGSRVGIIGESGSGKTIATRAMLDLLPPGLARVRGVMTFEGRDLGTLSASEMRAVRGAGIGMIFQEPMTSLNPAMTIGKQLAEGLRLHGRFSNADVRRLCVEMLLKVRIKEPEAALSAYPHEFSGGMRQRIMLAAVLLLKPRLLIADEPTTALDTLSQREVLDLIVELTHETGTALLLITHDLGLVARYTDHVLVLEKGILVESGATAKVLTRPSHPYTKALLASLPQRPDHPHQTTSSTPVILSIENLCVDYPGKRGLFRQRAAVRVLDAINFDVRQGEIVALVGGSGSGKTTLGRAALHLKTSTDGRVRFDGLELAKMNRAAIHAFRTQAQLVAQDPFSSLDPRMRVGEIVGASLRHMRGLSIAERRERVSQALAAVGLAGYDTRLPHQMSGGQRQRVAIARAVVSRPRLVIADEPVSGLDLTVQRRVLTLLKTLQREQGFACLFISHDLCVVEQVADRLIVLEEGRIVEAGSTASVFSEPQHPYTRALLAATPTIAAPKMATTSA